MPDMPEGSTVDFVLLTALELGTLVGCGSAALFFSCGCARWCAGPLESEAVLRCTLHCMKHVACCVARSSWEAYCALLVCCTNRSETVLAALLSPAAATLGVSVLPQRHGLVGTCGFEFLAFAITSAAGELPVCAHRACCTLHGACCMLHARC